mgnify:CR=1 FL=1
MKPAALILANDRIGRWSLRRGGGFGILCNSHPETLPDFQRMFPDEE